MSTSTTNYHWTESQIQAKKRNLQWLASTLSGLGLLLINIYIFFNFHTRNAFRNLESANKTKLTYNPTTESHHYCISLGFFLCLCVFNLFFRLLESYYLISIGPYVLKLIHINISCILKNYLFKSILFHHMECHNCPIFHYFCSFSPL